MTNNVLVSVITVSYNSEKTIKDSIESLISQSYSNYEYIVIDGGSSDGTLDIVSQYSSFITYFKSEPDNGIADAWNKGIKESSGELLIFLNSDDIFNQNTLEDAVDIYNKSDKKSLIYGTCYMFDDEGVKSCINHKFKGSEISNGKGFGFVHTTCFVPKVVYDEIGLFSEDIKIAIDTDFLVRAYVNDYEFIKGTHKVYMRLGGVSDEYAKNAYFEYLNVLFKYGLLSPNKLKALKAIYTVYYPFRVLFKNKVIKFHLRKIKHLLISVFNFFYQVLPTFKLKNKLLKSFGIAMGKNSYILKNTRFYTLGNINIGKNVIVNNGCLLDNRGYIFIGDNTSIAHNTKIYTGQHDVYSGFFEFNSKDVYIGNNVSIFSNVIILPGCCIEDGAIISAGSVVSGKIEKNCIYAGNPAKKVKTVNRKIRYKNNYPFWRAM